MNKKYLRFLALIPAVIGVILLICGICKVVDAGSMNVPNMGAPGWFESSSSQSSAQFAGIGMIIGGFFLAVPVSIVVFIIIRQNTQTPEERNRTMSKLEEVSKKFSDVFSQFGTTQPVEKKEEERFCEYCGSKISADEKKCSSCGASIVKKNKK